MKISRTRIHGQFGVLAVLLVSWNRLSTGAAVALALFLFPCVVESWSFALEIVMPKGDALQFVLCSGFDELMVSVVGLVVVGGSLWLWVHRTRLPSRLKDLCLNPQYD